MRPEQEEKQPPAQIDKHSAKTSRDRKLDEDAPMGEAFPDRDPTKKKTGEF